jgi:hypothetical protein
MRNGTSEFTFHWQEHDGPPVTPPARKGFGSTVLEQVMAEYAHTPPRIDFARSGVIYQVRGPLEALAAATLAPNAGTAARAQLSAGPQPSVA